MATKRMQLLRLLLTALLSLSFWTGVEALQCYSCSAESCSKLATAGATTTCANADDVCFSRFDATNLLATERGCLTAAAAPTACTGPDCVTCVSPDLCNDAGSPQHRCLVCSSLTSAECVTDPSSLVAAQCPMATGVDLTAAQCYNRVIGTVTERGCITSQRTVDECGGIGCATCTGPGCNAAEFPAGRQQCVACDGATCNSEASTTVTCDDPYDTCATVQRSNGNVMKSCEKAMTSADVAYCLANPAQCAFCGNRLCNGVPFDATTQRRCYRCDGTGCLKSAAQLTLCRLFDDDCYSSFTGFNPSRRGCVSELTAEEAVQCRAGGVPDSPCEVCSGSECNLQARSDHRCLSCSSVKDAACVNPTAGALQPVQCPAPSTELLADGQCLTRIVGTVTERGCISGEADLVACGEDGRYCATCGIENDGAGCNSKLFPSDRRRCTVGTEANAYCPDPWDDCVQLLQSGTRKRTCRSLLTETERSFCAANSNRCRFCGTDGCNAAEITFDYVECLSCDSGTDVRCATNPAALGTFERCATCASAIVTVDGKPITRRGCLASMPPEVSQVCPTTGSTACQRCSTNRCNTGNFPSARLQCYRCTSPPCVSHQDIRLEYCPQYTANDACIVQTSTDGQLLRLDCRSALSESEQATCLSPNPAGLCQMCGTAGCNDPATFGTSSSCVQCRSSLNPLCQEQALQIAAEPCADPANAACYTRLTAVGTLTSLTERGCLSDLAGTERDKCARGEDCIVCRSGRSGNCNTVQYPVAPITCFQCDSRTDGASCQAAQTAQQAPTCPQYDVANKCYTIVHSDGDTVRKCSTAAKEVECAGIGTCEVCLFRGCNSKPFSAIVVTPPPDPTTTPPPNGGAVTGGLTIPWLTWLLGALLCGASTGAGLLGHSGLHFL
ncbi:uncharacterized protein LOC128268852 [Anopheles cruzii]|uniref:uncharacterized protein LOC128268852 n=1 Tax=Anopheles cruzii TaxID=68878 RepID=UPI0022EC7A2F|nr:uncharacterized protein LOC128268852 [Anopheles cruzii]